MIFLLGGVLILGIFIGQITMRNRKRVNTYFAFSLLIFGLGGIFITGFNIVVYFIGLFSSDLRNQFKKGMYDQRTFTGSSMIIANLSYYLINQIYVPRINIIRQVFPWEYDPFLMTFTGLNWNAKDPIFNQTIMILYGVLIVIIMVSAFFTFLTEWKWLNFLSIFWIFLVVIMSIGLPMLSIFRVFKALLYQGSAMTTTICLFAGILSILGIPALSVLEIIYLRNKTYVDIEM